MHRGRTTVTNENILGLICGQDFSLSVTVLVVDELNAARFHY
jgi:hypothetical protein